MDRSAPGLEVERRPDWRRRIGIIGGLGPFAHLALESRLLEAATQHVGRALRDQEFPPWILACLPQVPDRSAALLSGGTSPIPMLLQGLRLLDQADFAVIACNTAHLFIQELRACVRLPILDIVAETIAVAACNSKQALTLGVLGSTGTLKAGLYQQAAERMGAQARFVTALDLSRGALRGEDIQKRFVTDLIFGSTSKPDPFRGGIKAGAHRSPTVRREMERRLRTLIGWLGEAGADVIVVGCTELSLLLDSPRCRSLPLIDPLKVAAQAAVGIAAGMRPLPR